MMDWTTVLVAVLGSGGACSLVTAFMSKRKYKAEAAMIEAEVEAKRKETERSYMEYIHEQFREITEAHKRESEELRTQNRELTKKVNDLEARINKFHEWLVIDNNQRINWYETELRKYNPDIKVPHCKPAPGFEEYDEADSSVLDTSAAPQ